MANADESENCSTRCNNDRNLVIVRNIPKEYHSKDLRGFFSSFVESNGFACFHYRHRCEDWSKFQESARCCLVEIADGPERLKEFVRTYNKTPWTNENGGILGGFCRIVPTRLANDEVTPKELTPPADVMPRGNVGTPSAFYKEAIKQCKLPASLVRKLGLEFRRTRKYGNVPPPENLRNPPTRRFDDNEEEEEEGKEEENNQEKEDDDEVEEWDRHEARYDDVTDQERTKERLYEEEMEVVWEKGGPGLVWYTDAFAREEQEPDTDAKWADDWDIDVSVYEHPDGGDKDSRDFLEMRRQEMVRNGQLNESVFRRKAPDSSSSSYKRRLNNDDDDEPSNSSAYDNGVGRRILEKQGWRDGAGLGRSVKGKSESVHEEMKEVSRGKADLRGIGYRGEKLDRFVKPQRPQQHSIGTIYDDRNASDPPESLLTRTEPTWTKHRAKKR